MRRSPSGVALATSTLVLLAAATPALAAVPQQIMPLAEVQPGMQCKALTVISGVDPVDFDAAVISVEGGPRPTDAGIVMRFSGDAVAAGGIASGFSGSPVRCPRADGSYGVIGAIAYGIGQYDNLVGQVTPIEAMLAMPATADAPIAPLIGVAAPAPTAAKASAARATTTASAKKKGKAKSTTTTKATTATPSPSTTTTSIDQRTQLPLTLAGPKGALGTAFVRAAAKAGKQVILAPPAAQTPAAGAPALRPGDAVAATNVFGDVTAGAIGTVTYVDGDKVYAFGHPSAGTGPARLQMERARISTVIASPTIGEQASYKLGTPIGAVGTIGFDGAFGVAGLLGAAPASIAVSATVRDTAGAVVQETKSNVVDERPIRGGNTTTLLPLAAAANAGTALQRLTTQTAIGGAARACTTIFLKGGTTGEEKPLLQCFDTIIPQPTAEGGVESGVAAAVAASVTPMTSAERFLKLVDRVSVDIRFRREADTAEIVKIRAPKRPKAGADATVRVTIVQGTSGAERVVPVKVRIPRYAAGERTGIVVTADAIESAATGEDGGSLEELFVVDEETPEAPKTLAGLRALYTTAGISGLRAAVIPGVTGAALKAGLQGDEDSDLDESDLAEVTKRTKLVSETPSVELTGIASATVTPR